MKCHFKEPRSGNLGDENSTHTQSSPITLQGALAAIVTLTNFRVLIEWFSSLIFLFIVLDVRCNSSCLLVSAETKNMEIDYDLTTTLTILSNLTRTAFIDVHVNLSYIFWSDETEQNIKRSNLNGSDIRIIINKTEAHDGLAVQWKTTQLYWTDALYGIISVSDLEGNPEGNPPPPPTHQDMKQTARNIRNILFRIFRSLLVNPK